MVDTIRDLAQLQALFADNTTGDIEPQDLRDFLVSSRLYSWLVYDAIVDSDNPNAAPDVYDTLAGAIADGRRAIWYRKGTDSSDIVIDAAAAVNLIVGASPQQSELTVNIRCEKPFVSFQYLGLPGKRLTLAAPFCTAFACLATGTIDLITAQLNGSITSSSTSIPFDGGSETLPVRGYLRVGNEVIQFSAGGGATSGTLTVGGGADGRGALDTLAQSHADDTPFTVLNRGSIEVDAADCQVIQCRFIGLDNELAAALYIGPRARRMNTTSNFFLGNNVWACIVQAPDNTDAIYRTANHSIVSNVFAAGDMQPFSAVIEIRNRPDLVSSGEIRLGRLAGNSFSGFEVAHLWGQITMWNVSGNSIDAGVGVNLQAHSAQVLINQGGGIGATDATIPFKTPTGNGTIPRKGLVEIDNEQIFFSSRDANNLYGCRRGVNGTTAAPHANNAVIRSLCPRGFCFRGGGAVMSATGNVISGNTFYALMVVGLDHTGAGSSFAPANWASNVMVSCTRLYGGFNFAWSGNMILGATTFDLRSASGQSIIGGRVPATIINIPTDLLFNAPGTTVIPRFAFPEGAPVNMGHTSGGLSYKTQRLINRTGANSVANEVVLIDTANDNSFVKPGGMAGSTRVAGVVVEGGIATGSDALVAHDGVVNVLCTTAAVARGDLLEYSATAGHAQKAAAGTEGSAFARALTAKAAGSTGTVRAQLM